MTSPRDTSDSSAYGTGRTVALLLAAVVLLLALLGGLVVLFYSVLTPDLEVATTSGSAPGLRWVRSLYGFGPSADEQLRSPTSVAIGPNGDVYATDPSRARVMVFRADGTFRRLVHTGSGGTARGELIRPESIDVDDAGNLYIADSLANKVIVFDRRGRFVREWPTPTQARGVSVSDDRVYVLGVGTVNVYRVDGQAEVAFGERGSAPGQIDAYQGVAARGGFIYLADAHNKRLQAFDVKGNLVWAVPRGEADRSSAATSSPPANGSVVSSVSAETSGSVTLHSWDLPQDLTFDGSGQLVVADAFKFELAVVDPETGRVSATYGGFGTADGEFRYPTSVAYDPRRDWFAVADTENNRVQIVEIGGSQGPSPVAAWRALSSPYRYLLVPVLFLLTSIALATWVALRLLRVRDASRAMSDAHVDGAGAR